MTDDQLRRLRELSSRYRATLEVSHEKARQALSALPAMLDEVERLRKVEAASRAIAERVEYILDTTGGVLCTDSSALGAQYPNLFWEWNEPELADAHSRLKAALEGK